MLRWWDGNHWTDRSSWTPPPTKPNTAAPQPKWRWKTRWIVLASVVSTLVVLTIALAVIGAIANSPSGVGPTDVTVTAANTYAAYRLQQSEPTTDSITVPKGSEYKVYCHETTGTNGSDRSFLVEVDVKTVLLIHDNQVSSVSGSDYPDCNSMSKDRIDQFAQDHRFYGVLATEH